VQVDGDLVAEGVGHLEEGLEDLHGEAEGYGAGLGLVVAVARLVVVVVVAAAVVLLPEGGGGGGGLVEGFGGEQVFGCAAVVEVFKAPDGED
jgi:hypothetical protein